MEAQAVASRYTLALFDVASKGDAASVRDELNGLGDLLETSPDFARFVADPVTSAEQQEKALEAMFSGKLSSDVLNFLKLLARRRRLSLLPEMIPAYAARVDEAEGVQPVEIVSATALSADQLTALCEKLRQRIGKQVRPTVSVDSTLIGGFRIRIGDRIEDFSIATKLANFKTNVINA